MMVSRVETNLFERKPFRKKLSRVLRTFLKTGVKVNFPPQGFDPRKASDRVLNDYFLPPRPDRKIAPRAFRLWQKAMSGPPIWPTAPDGKQILETLFAESRLRSHPRLAGPSHATFEAASSNWSGAYVRPLDFSHMTRIQGLWTVPNPDPPKAGAGEYASSAWVGLDGNDPASRSLPQIGSGHWVTADSAGNAQRSLFAWWQWFVRGSQNNGQIAIKAVPVKSGDLIYAQVTAVAPSLASLFIINLTTKVAFPFWFQYASPIQPIQSPSNPLPVHIEGRTAAWILERPSHRDNPMLYPLPDYHSTTFKICCAGTDSPGPSQDVDLRRAHLVRMVDWDLPPAASKAVSTPSRDGATSVLLHYG